MSSFEFEVECHITCFESGNGKIFSYNNYKLTETSGNTIQNNF